MAVLGGVGVREERDSVVPPAAATPAFGRAEAYFARRLFPRRFVLGWYMSGRWPWVAVLVAGFRLGLWLLVPGAG